MNKIDVYERYLRSDNYCLGHVYGRYSRAKEDAWEYCEKLCREKNGRELKIIGANSSFFSAGFEFIEDGVVKFMYITHANDYVWEV